MTHRIVKSFLFRLLLILLIELSFFAKNYLPNWLEYISKIMKAVYMYTVFLNETVGCVIEILSQNPSNQYPVGQASYPISEKREFKHSLVFQ